MPRNQLSPTHMSIAQVKHTHITKVSKNMIKISQKDNNSGALAVKEAATTILISMGVNSKIV